MHKFLKINKNVNRLPFKCGHEDTQDHWRNLSSSRSCNQPYCGLDMRQSPLYCLQAEHLPVILCSWAFARTSWVWSLYLSPNSSLLTLIIAKLVLPKCLPVSTYHYHSSPSHLPRERPARATTRPSRSQRELFKMSHPRPPSLPPRHLPLVSQCSLTCLASIIRSLLT